MSQNYHRTLHLSSNIYIISESEIICQIRILFLIFSAIACMNFGITAFPILAHCSSNFPINLKSSGNVVNRLASSIVILLHSVGCIIKERLELIVFGKVLDGFKNESLFVENPGPLE